MAMRFSDAEDAIRALLRTSGGTIAGNQLGALYNIHDGLRDCIDQFGGAKRFCECSKRLEFVADMGSGQIRADTQIDELEQELEDTHAQLREAREAAERAAAEREAVAATLAKETEKARRALSAAIAAEAKAAGLDIGAQVLVRLGGKYVNMRVVGYRGSKVEVEDADTQKTYILQGETIAEVAKAQSQRREQQATDSGIVTWECHVNGSWTPFSDTLTQTLEAAYSSGAVASGVTVAGVFKRAEHSYAINWQRMVQINEKTAVERPIRRTKRPGVRSTSASEFTLPGSPKTLAEPITFMNTTIQKYTLKPTGAQVSGLFEEYHLGVAYKQVHQMLHGGARRRAAGLAGYHHHATAGYVAPRISKVEYFENPFLEERFDATKQHMNATDEQWVFHGTSSEQAAQNIMREGFLVGGVDTSRITGLAVGVVNGSSYGNGVYAARGPDTPMAYMKSSCKCVVLARALPGTHVVADRGGSADSWTPASHPDWIIFGRKELLLPRYLVFFE